MNTQEENLNKLEIKNLKQEIYRAYDTLKKPKFARLALNDGISLFAGILLVMLAFFVPVFIESEIIWYSIIVVALISLIIIVLFVRKHLIPFFKETRHKNRMRGAMKQKNFHEKLKEHVLSEKESDVHVIEQCITLFKEEISNYQEERYKPFGVKFVIGFVVLYLSTLLVGTMRVIETGEDLKTVTVLFSKIIYAMSVLLYFVNLFWSLIITLLRKKEYRYREIIVLLEEMKLNYLIHFSQKRMI